MPSRSLVSIIVNTADRPGDLRRCLNGCLSQTYPRKEIVVVNNGFGEETQDVLGEVSLEAKKRGIDFKVVEDKTKKLSYLFNVGWRSADPQSSIFAYCADDTEPDLGWLQAIVDHLTVFPDAGAVSGPTISTTQPPGEMFNLYSIMKRSWWRRLILRLYEFFVLEDKTFEPGRWCQSGAFTMGAGIELPQIKEPVEIELLTSGNMGIWRSAMEKVGGFDENFYFNHADGDLFIRLGKTGYKMMFDPGVRVLHHMRFGPTRHPNIMGRDTAFYYLKDVRPQSLRGWVGWIINLGVFFGYWIYRSFQERSIKPWLLGWGGFGRGIWDFFVTSTRERNRLLSKLALGAVFGLLLWALNRNLGQFWGSLAYGDCLPWPKTAQQAFDQFFSAWSPASPGVIMPQQPVLSSLTFFEGILITLCFGNSILAQWIFHFAPLPLAFLTCYWALKYLFSQLSSQAPRVTLAQKIYGGEPIISLSKENLVRLAALIASFAYGFNMVAIGEMTGGFEGNMYIHAFLPVIVVLMAKIVSRQRALFNWFWLVLFFTAAYILSDHIVLYLLLIVPWFVLWSGWRHASHSGDDLEGDRHFCWSRFIVGIVVASVVFGAAFALALPLTWFYSYYFLSTALPFLSGGQSLRPEVLEFLIRNVNDTYRYWTMGDTLRQGGGAYHQLFKSGVLWARAGFALPIMAFLPWLFAKNWRGRRLAVLLVATLSAVFVVWFVDFTRIREALPWHRAFPALFRLRNPARLNLLVSFFYAPLVFLGLHSVLERLAMPLHGKSWEWFKLILGGCLGALLGGLFFYYHPVFSGTYTLDYNRGSSMVVSSRYYQLSQFITQKHQEEGFFRALYLPWDHENAEVKLYWLDSYVYGVPINYGAYSNDEYLAVMVSNYKNLATEKDLSLGARLASAGVRYLVVLTGQSSNEPAFFRFDYQTPWLLGPSFQYERIMNSQHDLEKILSTDEFIIYRNRAFGPDLIDPVISGAPPESSEMSYLKDRKRFSVLVASFSWGLLIIFLLISGAKSFKPSPKVFWEKFVYKDQ